MSEYGLQMTKEKINERRIEKYRMNEIRVDNESNKNICNHRI